MLTVEKILSILEEKGSKNEKNNMEDKMVCIWNVGGFGTPFYRPIVDMYIDTISSDKIFYMKNEKVRDIDVLQIVETKDETKIGKTMTQEQFIKKLQSYPKDLLVVMGGHKEEGWAISPANILTIDTKDREMMSEIKVEKFMKPFVGKENYVALMM